MIKVLLGRILPAGAAAALLFSSASPLKPALRAFESAGNALGGNDTADTSDIVMPDEASVQKALGQGMGGFSGGGFSITKMLHNLFGPSDSDRAKAQLQAIIAGVKGNAQGPAPGKPLPKGTGTPKKPAAPAGKGGAATTTPKPSPTPAASPPAAASTGSPR
jgi:hypothetical protein